MTNQVIQVDGMSCEHCKSAVENALTALSGVDQAEVNLEAGNVTVDYDSEKVTTNDMKDAIEDQGYDVPQL
ncbi:copper chaperone CopZ [Staphylococcus auricularis]|uniref:Copper chaperone CopZ n=1 Tax=Staphylococcus auricularis TaxID=29379 RepID=A0AAP8TT63_9STAP|nr:copper chaperone CopZ [Staphylococcus auricularis]MBM0867179.1 copper chaperone [Staphylococcus auricularis]MCG7340869.1 copper chaperone CopZ [Staphylococcus auricularis]MDC6327369.1 copper chaperone CopZ [Staphylococcus auricularis]MDN4534058.1 copper chaperone CopZ [Staphylococcus auricularis]PNZ67638.1 copper chaperone [Staphylococcus auricularis]